MESEEDEDAAAGNGGPPEKKVVGSTTKGKGLKKWRRIQRRDVAAAAAAPPSTANDDEDDDDVDPHHRFLKRDSRRLAPALRGSSSPSPSQKDKFKMSNSSSNGHLIFGASQHKKAMATDHHLLFADSIFSLESLHQALQHEIWNFQEIGKEAVLVGVEEAQAHIYERKVEEAKGKAELEGIWAEEVFRQKIEAEVECLTMRKTYEELKGVSAAGENEISRECSSSRKMRKKYGFCFFVQLMLMLLLLFLGFRLLFSKHLPPTCVPT